MEIRTNLTSLTAGALVLGSVVVEVTAGALVLGSVVVVRCVP